MYLIDHVAELWFVNLLIYIIKGIYMHTVVDLKRCYGLIERMNNDYSFELRK